jgi:general secretion pathway protein G
MILGIASLVLSLAVVGGLMGLIAIVLSIIGLTKPGRKDMAITGLVTGAFALLMALLALFFWIGVYSAMSRASALKVRMAEADMSTLSTALNTFEADTGRYPTTEEGLAALLANPGVSGGGSWHGPYIAKWYYDPWGCNYIYICPGTVHPGSFDLLSVGPDGREGTADDIVRK